ncbi:hypothetical protein GCM10023219_23700 [Stakelama sediminis]
MKRLPFLRRLRSLPQAREALALVEFALSLPLALLLILTGLEMTNYVIVRMRVSQIALYVADNMARIGEGSVLSAKQISESDINDVLTGAGMQAGSLDLYKNGRIIISDLEPVTSPNLLKKYVIKWQRCRGDMTTHKSSYGNVGDINSGMGPAGRQVIAMDNNATMFVEVYYKYQPLIKTSLSPTQDMVEIASMAVRDNRDLTQIYNTSGATVSSC